MDARDEMELLARSHAVGCQLEAEIQLNTLKVEQTNNQINTLSEQAARFRVMKAQAVQGMHANDAIAIVDTVSECLVHLQCAIRLLEAKNESLEGTIYITRLAQDALGKYRNKIPDIPRI